MGVLIYANMMIIIFKIFLINAVWDSAWVILDFWGWY